MVWDGLRQRMEFEGCALTRRRGESKEGKSECIEKAERGRRRILRGRRNRRRAGVARLGQLGSPQRSGAWDSVVVCGVDGGETGVFLWEFVEHKNRISGANRDAGAAIDAIVGLDVELRRFGETSLILLGVNAVNGAGLHAQFILGTSIGNYVCHGGCVCNSDASVKWKKTGGETRQLCAGGWGIARNGEASSRSKKPLPDGSGCLPRAQSHAPSKRREKYQWLLIRRSTLKKWDTP